MRIALVTGIFPPDVGGPATYVPAIAAALLARGHEVRVVTTSEPVDLERDERHAFPLVRIDRRSGILRRTWRVAAAVARAARDADVVYANGMFVEAALGAWLAGRPLVAKVVGDEAWERSTARGWTSLELEAFQHASPGAGPRALKLLRNLGVRTADHVIVPSAYLRGVVTGWGVDDDRCTVVYNAVADVPVTAPPERQPGGALRVVTAGRLVPWKGVDLLIRALAGLDGVVLDVVGDGPCRRELETLARDEGVRDRVRFTGRATPASLHALMRDADVFVLASSYEGLPHVVLEAMQQGLAVVATPAGGNPEVVQHERTGLIASRTPEALRAALVRLRDDPALRTRLADGGRALVATRFDQRRMVEETERVLVRTARGIRLLTVGSDRLGEPLTSARQKKLHALRDVCPVTVVAYRDAAQPPPHLDGVRFVLVPDAGGPLRRAARLSWATMRAVPALARRARVLVVAAQSPYQGLALLAGRTLARLRGRDVRMVVEAHGDWVEVGTLLGRFPRAAAPLVRALTGFVLARADAVRTVSAFTAELVRRRSQAPVVTFPAFTDVDLFLAAPADAARRHLLYAGVLTPVKAVDVLLDAVARLARDGSAVPLVLAGDGPERRRLEALAGELGIGELVRFRGHVEQRELRDLMATAHALVLPSRTEGFGLVLVEAMACATPAVAADVGGTSELVTDGVTGLLVPPGDAVALAAALRRLLRDPDVARAMGQRARSAVRRRFAGEGWAEGQRRLIELAAGPAVG